MNKFVVLCFVSLIASSSMACAEMLTHKPYLPAGATACHTDYDCPDAYVCGFAGVDQYASCLYKGNE
jgi:hypothetical protein